MQEMVWHSCRWNQENKCRWKEAYDEQGQCFQTLAAFHARRVLNYNCSLLPAHIIPIRASERVVQAKFLFKCFASRAPLMLGRCAAPALESRAAPGFGGSPGRRGAGPARSHCTSALPGCTHTHRRLALVPHPRRQPESEPVWAGRTTLDSCSFTWYTYCCYCMILLLYVTLLLYVIVIVILYNHFIVHISLL